MPRVVLLLIVIGLIVYSLIELYQSDSSRVRLMPRWLWAAAIIALPGVGALGWLFLGRPTKDSGPQNGRQRPLAPDDDPDFLRGL